jgi:hypothetical protein
MEKVKRTIETVTLYTDSEPVTIQFKETKGTKRDVHTYTVLEPSQYSGIKQGVTGVTGFRDKSGPLMQWAANLAVEAKNNGASDSEAKYAHARQKEAAGEIGTAVHDWIESYLKGKELPFTNEMRPSIEGFMRWLELSRANTLWSERIVYSKEHDYAGKLDWGGEINGKYGLIDFKTGSHDEEYNSYRKQKTGRIRCKTEHIVQNAGYDIAITEEDRKPASFYGVLYIPVSGRVHYFESKDTQSAQDVFVHTLRAKRAWTLADQLNKYELRS